MRRNTAPAVTIQPCPGRHQLLRIRWSFKGKRQTIYISSLQKELAERIRQIILADLEQGTITALAGRYKTLLSETVNSRELQSQKLNLLQEFDLYLKAIGRDQYTPNYYYHVRQMLISWGTLTIAQVPQRLLQMNYAPVTFNQRKGLLSIFFNWLIKKKRLQENPLDDLKSMRQSRQTNTRRKPFTEKEIGTILQALKKDTYSQSHSYPHSQYHDIIYFMLHTGVRNGEAIGLTVGDVDFAAGEIRIWRSLSRTRKGSNIAARVLKSTKMDNERLLPLKGAPKLRSMLLRLCKGKGANDFVFLNKRGNPIDDRMLQRRCFKPLLEKLQIRDRDLYACRHTFATRAVRQGLRPHEVAYLMGDSVEVVLSNYFHNQHRPGVLPAAIGDMPNSDSTLPVK